MSHTATTAETTASVCQTVQNVIDNKHVGFAAVARRDLSVHKSGDGDSGGGDGGGGVAPETCVRRVYKQFVSADAEQAGDENWLVFSDAALRRSVAQTLVQRRTPTESLPRVFVKQHVSLGGNTEYFTAEQREPDQQDGSGKPLTIWVLHSIGVSASGARSLLVGALLCQQPFGVVLPAVAWLDTAKTECFIAK